MNKLIIASVGLIISYSTYAVEASIGRVVEVHGSGFISRDGKTKEIRKGDQLYPHSEIVVEHAGQVTFTDNADHRYHLGNSSSVAIGTNSVELRTGDVWFQSLNKTENYQLKTANALVDFQGGEAILSYDITKGKTQLMVINGMMKLSNIHTSELNLSVAEGNFSFIDLNYEAGAPRDPTPVGQKTYKQLVGMFHGVGPLDKKSEGVFNNHGETKREIASVHEETHAVTKHEVTHDVVQTSDEKPVPRNKDLEAYKAKMKQKKPAVAMCKPPTPSYKTAPMVVHIYGLKSATAPSTSSRMPASVKEEPATATKIENNDVKETDKLLQALKNL